MNVLRRPVESASKVAAQNAIISISDRLLSATSNRSTRLLPIHITQVIWIPQKRKFAANHVSC